MSGAQHILVRAGILTGMSLTVFGLTTLFDRAPDDITSASHVATDDSGRSAPAVWNGEINYGPAYAALNPYQSQSTQIAGTLFDPSDDYWGLPRSVGHDTVSAYCAACHSLQIVMQQRQSRDGWDYLLTWMTDKQGMAAPPPETREEILNYLAREFGGE